MQTSIFTWLCSTKLVDSGDPHSRGHIATTSVDRSEHERKKVAYITAHNELFFLPTVVFLA